MNDIKRGPGYWKFNNSLTDDATYVSRLNDLIRDIVSSFSENDDPRINWEFLKYKIRQFTQIYSKEKARERRVKQKQLEKEIEKMEHSITEHCDSILLNQLETAEAELDELYNYITEGSLLRSKVRLFEHGEKSSKYFLGLEKRNKSKTHVQKLLANPHSSEEITEFNEVQKELKRFYKNLYTKQSLKTEKECLNYLSKINAPKLSESDRSICEDKLTLNECWLALSSMKNGKSPGNDGLTKEFYVCFFEELGWLVCKTLNFSFDNGELSASQKQAVITLIEKKDCDKRLVKN